MREQTTAPRFCSPYLQFARFIKGSLLFVKDVCLGADSIHARKDLSDMKRRWRTRTAYRWLQKKKKKKQT